MHTHPSLSRSSLPTILLPDPIRGGNSSQREQRASVIYPYRLPIRLGGPQPCIVYFDLAWGEIPEQWTVAEDLKLFYAGTDITEAVPRHLIERQIHQQADAVERQIEDRRIDRLAEQCVPSDG